MLIGPKMNKCLFCESDHPPPVPGDAIRPLLMCRDALVQKLTELRGELFSERLFHREAIDRELQTNKRSYEALQQVKRATEYQLLIKVEQ